MDVLEHYDTIVVGAGPAGIMSACYASAAGSVLLVDAMAFPRDKSCGGMLNEYSQAFLKRLGPIPKEIFMDPNWINFRFFDWDRDIRKGTSLRFANVSRKGFDHWLMGYLPSNVTFMPRTRFLSCTQNHFGVTAQLRDAASATAEAAQVHCKYLIGCDGPRSSVRAALPVTQLALYKTLQEYVELKEDIEPFFDCLYSRHIGKDYGYGYVIPKGDQAILGSVFFPGSKNCKELHEKALEEFSHFYPFGPSRKREAWTAVKVQRVSDIVGGYGRVLLCGDAGGIMSPSSGEGISFALNSGTLAGKAVAEAKEGASDLDESIALKTYRRLLKPIKGNIRKRLMYFPVLNSNWGKWLGGSSPNFLVDAVAHRI